MRRSFSSVCSSRYTTPGGRTNTPSLHSRTKSINICPVGALVAATRRKMWMNRRSRTCTGRKRLREARCAGGTAAGGDSVLPAIRAMDPRLTLEPDAYASVRFDVDDPGCTAADSSIAVAPSTTREQRDALPSPNGASTIPEPRQVARPTPVPRVDAPEVKAVLDDLPPVLPEAEDVPPDAVTDGDRRASCRGGHRRGDRTACQPVRATGPIGLCRDVDRRAAQQADLPRA